jgi:hypothetical protein
VSVAESTEKREAAALLADIFAGEAERAANALTQLGIGWYAGSRRDEDGYQRPDVITICGREHLLRLKEEIGARLADAKRRRELEILATGAHWEREEAPPELGALILTKKRQGLTDARIAQWLTRWGEPPLLGRKGWTKTAVGEIRREAEREETLAFVREASSGAWSTPERERAVAYLVAALSGAAAGIMEEAVVFRPAAEECRYVPEALERLEIDYDCLQNDAEETIRYAVAGRDDVLRLVAACAPRLSEAKRGMRLQELALRLLWGPYRIEPKILARMRLRRDEGMSAPELAKRMNKAKTPVAGGCKAWSAAMVRNALRAAEIEAALMAPGPER